MSVHGKNILITGASKGIGLACVKHFEKENNIISVSRTGTVTEQGNVRDPQFRKHLINEYTPDIFINNAGVLDHEFHKTFDTNVMAAGDLLQAFYNKMPTGDIINVTSIAANKVGWDGMPDMRVWYLASKRALKELSRNLNSSKKRPVRVTSLEPDHVDTTIGGGKMYNPDYSKAGLDHFAPMPASYVAEVIDWIVSQPAYVTISALEISNLHRRNRGVS